MLLRGNHYYTGKKRYTCPTMDTSNRLQDLNDMIPYQAAWSRWNGGLVLFLAFRGLRDVGFGDIPIGEDEIIDADF